MDSNHRSRRRQIYSLFPLAAREPSHIKFALPKQKSPNKKNGAGEWNRTINLLITNQLLCLIELHQRVSQCVGASGRNRTTDTGIFSPLLYRLSYLGLWRRGWDSNPRCDTASLVFKTSSLNHSDTSPYMFLQIILYHIFFYFSIYFYKNFIT